MSKLNDFVAEIKTNGMMRTARYSVIMPAMTDASLVGIYCDQITLPGLNYNTTANVTWGETREVPYGRLFDNLTLSFYVDNDMKVKKFFDAWQHSIQNPIDRTFNYYNDYVKDIQIDVEDVASMTKYSIKLYECYPKTVGTVQLDYASRDVMKLSVSLAYKYWKPIDGYTADTYLNQDSSGILGEFQSVFNGIANSQIGGLLMNAGISYAQNKVTSFSGRSVRLK